MIVIAFLILTITGLMATQPLLKAHDRGMARVRGRSWEPDRG